MSQSQFTDTRVKGVLGCAKGMVGSDQQTQTKCLELALGKDSKAAQLSSCISASNRDYGQRILCAAEGVLTPEKSHALACAVQANGAAEVAACVPNESLRKALNVDTCIKGG